MKFVSELSACAATLEKILCWRWEYASQIERSRQSVVVIVCCNGNREPRTEVDIEIRPEEMRLLLNTESV